MGGGRYSNILATATPLTPLPQKSSFSIFTSDIAHLYMCDTSDE